MSDTTLTNEQRDLINEWAFDMCEEYDLPLTNNEPRVQNGIQLRHIGEFTGDLMDLIKGIVSQREAAAWEAAVQRVRECHAECTDECDLCIARDEMLSDLRTNPYRDDEPLALEAS